jgi:hypothetical protein
MSCKSGTTSGNIAIRHSCYRIHVICLQNSAASHWLQPPHSKITSTCLSLSRAITDSCVKEKTYSIVYGSWLTGHTVYISVQCKVNRLVREKEVYKHVNTCTMFFQLYVRKERHFILYTKTFFRRNSIRTECQLKSTHPSVRPAVRRKQLENGWTGFRQCYNADFYYSL